MNRKRIGHRKLVMEFLEDRCLLSATGNPVQTKLGAYASDRVLVRFHEDSHRANAADLAIASRLESVGRDGLYKFYLNRSETVGSAISRLESLPGIASVEPDYLLQGAAVFPNDPRFSSQYALNNIGQTGGVVDADIDAPEAWSSSTGSHSVVVAVVDGAMAYNHPDLAANIWNNADEIPGNGIDDDGNGFVDDARGWDFVDDDSDPGNQIFHATHLGGIIGAEGNNGLGVSGVAWNVRLTPLRFLDDTGSGYTSDAVQALD